MALTIRQISIGLLCLGFMVIALTSFATEWAGEFGDKFSGDVITIGGEINNTMETMYGRVKADSNTIESSELYTGSSNMQDFSVKPYQVVKGSIGTFKMASNLTTNVARMGLFPQWVFTLAVAVFLITITYLALSAIFKHDT